MYCYGGILLLIALLFFSLFLLFANFVTLLFSSKLLDRVVKNVASKLILGTVVLWDILWTTWHHRNLKSTWSVSFCEVTSALFGGLGSVRAANTNTIHRSRRGDEQTKPSTPMRCWFKAKRYWFKSKTFDWKSYTGSVGYLTLLYWRCRRRINHGFFLLRFSTGSKYNTIQSFLTLN